MQFENVPKEPKIIISIVNLNNLNNFYDFMDNSPNNKSGLSYSYIWIQKWCFKAVKILIVTNTHFLKKEIYYIFK